MSVLIAFEVLETAAAIRWDAAGELIILDAEPSTAVPLTGAAGRGRAVTGDAAFAASARVVAAAAVVIIGLRVDAGLAAFDRAVLTFFLFLVPLLSFLLGGCLGDACPSSQAQRGQKTAEAAAGQRLA
jgi:hypothetical protein